MSPFKQDLIGYDDLHKILIVDDEEKIRNILKIMLERWGYKTEQAINGEEALKLLQKDNFSLVITDLKMPYMGGMELIKEIRKIDPKYPVMVLTAFGSTQSAADTMEEGAVCYLTKPFDEGKMIKKVKKYIRLSGPNILTAYCSIHKDEILFRGGIKFLDNTFKIFTKRCSKCKRSDYDRGYFDGIKIGNSKK